MLSKPILLTDLAKDLNMLLSTAARQRLHRDNIQTRTTLITTALATVVGAAAGFYTTGVSGAVFGGPTLASAALFVHAFGMRRFEGKLAAAAASSLGLASFGLAYATDLSIEFRTTEDISRMLRNEALTAIASGRNQYTNSETVTKWAPLGERIPIGTVKVTAEFIGNKNSCRVARVSINGGEPEEIAVYKPAIGDRYLECNRN
jgi:hypothetical protein